MFPNIFRLHGHILGRQFLLESKCEIYVDRPVTSKLSLVYFPPSRTMYNLEIKRSGGLSKWRVIVPQVPTIRRFGPTFVRSK